MSALRRLALVLLLVASLPAAAAVPELRIEAPPELAALAQRLRAFDTTRLEPALTMTGVTDPDPPVTVVLAPEASELARRAPDWASGYAMSEAGVVVLIPARAPAYPDRSLEALLVHELTHVYLSRAAAGHPVPRWFNEGVALNAAREWTFDDDRRVAMGILFGGRVGFDQLDAEFQLGPANAGRAYALAGALVRDLVVVGGPTLPSRILSDVAGGREFDAAFAHASGMSLDSYAASFWRSTLVWYRWVPVLSSSVTLWTGITLLAIYAIRTRRRRDRALLAAEAEAERAEAWLGVAEDEAPPEETVH